jgi:hypothetical protein
VQKAHIASAFRDAILLATHASVVLSDCDPVFLRYFRPDEARFVMNLFRTIAGLPYDVPFDIEDMTKHMTLAYREEFQTLRIYYGDNPLENEAVDAGARPCLQGADPAYLTVSFDGVRYMSVCETGLQRYPLMNDITCDDLGDRDTDLMASLGSIILHEIIHWKELTQLTPGFDIYINPNPDRYNWGLYSRLEKPPRHQSFRGLWSLQCASPYHSVPCGACSLWPQTERQQRGQLRVLCPF